MTFASVLVAFNNTRAVTAAIARTLGDAFFHKAKPEIWHKTVVTNAIIRADAIAILTAPFANGFADASVFQGEARITPGAIPLGASACIGRRTCSIPPTRYRAMWFANRLRLIVINKTLVADAFSGRDTRAVATVHLADRLAYAFRTFIAISVTVVALASLWRDASAHFAWFATIWLANARVHRLITVVAKTHLRRYALAENADFAFRHAGEAIGLILLVTNQAFTDVRRHAIAVSAFAIAYRLAHEVFNFLEAGTARADMRFVAISVVTFALLVTDGTTSESV